MGNVVAFKLNNELEKSIKKISHISELINIQSEQKYKEIISKIENNETEVDVVILGTKVNDPISLAQRLHFIEKNISVIIITEKAEYHKMLDALQFAPFLGEEVSCHSVENIKNFKEKVQSAIFNTRKRKEYKESVANINVQIPGQNSLQLQTARYIDRLLDSAPIGVVLLDNNHKILAWNKKSQELFGKNERDALGTSLVTFFPPTEANKLLGILSSSSGTPKETLSRENIQKELQYLEAAVTKLDDIRNNFLIIFEDVTERKNSVKLLEESEEKFRTLADNIPNLAWMADADGYIFWYNSKWYEYTGTTPDNMEGWGWQSVHHPDTLQKVLKQWKKSIQTGEPFNMVFPIKGADNTFRPFLTRVNPVKDSSGKIIRWFGTNTDISEQKELEKQKDEFLAVASHELKTPVTSIKAYGQVLQTVFEREGNAKAVAQLSKMDAQIDKLTSLIADLLDVTKIHSGRLVMHHEEFDFNQLVKEIIAELQLTTERHKIIKQLDKSKKMYGDRERIGQVLTNLITNAIKYSPHTTEIIVKSTVNKENITLCVQDFGVGIPKEKQEKVFEQFFRVSGDKQHTFPGLGLGLYISSEIISRLGGKIWVESQKGKGSTFCFTLPCKRTSMKRFLKKNDEAITHE